MSTASRRARSAAPARERGARALASVLFAMGLGCVAASVNAQGGQGARIPLQSEGCDALERSELQRLLALELAARRGPVPSIRLLCRGLMLHVELRERPAAQPLNLTLDLSGSRPEARARIVALSIAELADTLRARRTRPQPETGDMLQPQHTSPPSAAREPTLQAQPAADAQHGKRVASPLAPAGDLQPRAAPDESRPGASAGESQPRAAADGSSPRASGAVQPEGPPAAAKGPALALGLFLAAGVARVLEPAAFAPALSLGVVGRHVAFSLAADVALELARVAQSDALVNARVLSVSLAPAWHVASEPLDVSLALGLRAGHAQLSASARSAGLRGRELSGFLLMPLLRAALALRLSRSFALSVSLESNYVLTPLRGLDADAQPLVSMQGLRLCAALGLTLWLH